MHPIDLIFFLLGSICSKRGWGEAWGVGGVVFFGVPTEFPSSFQNDPQVLNVFPNLFPIAPHVV